MFRKESLTYKQNFKNSVFSDFSSWYKVCNLKESLFVFNCQTVFSSCLLFYILRKIVRNCYETLSTRNKKKTKETFSTEARPTFLIKKCTVPALNN